MRLLFLLTLLCLCSFEVVAQKQLVLIKKNKVVARISEGDFIRFRRKGEDHFTKGFIEGIKQDFFRIGEDTTYLYDVAAVDLRGHSNSAFKLKDAGVKLIAVGSLLVLADLFNSHKVDHGVVIVSSALIGSGIILQFFNNDIYKMNHKRRIITMSIK